MAGRRFGATLALLATLAVTALQSAGGAMQAAPLPPYLTPDAAHISLNDKWQGAVEVSGIRRANPPSVPAEPDQWVWAETCGTAAQRVVFYRDFELLGPPVEAELGEFGLYVSPAPAGWRGLESFELLVNSYPAFTWKAADGHPHSVMLSAGARSAFHVGRNLLTIRATRPALPSTIAGCNGKEQTKIALHVELGLSFKADLEVPQREPRDSGVRFGTHFMVAAVLRNNGPDRAVGVTFSVHWGAGEGTAALFSGAFHPSSDEPLPKVAAVCKRTTPQGVLANCTIDELDPNEQVTLVAVVETTEPGVRAGEAGWDHLLTGVTFWAHAKTGDAVTGNESQQIPIVLCDPNKEAPPTFPACVGYRRELEERSK